LGKLLTPISCTQLAELVVAADHFLVDTLTDFCCIELRKLMSFKAVWPVLDETLKVGLDAVTDLCVEVLKNK
jgi:hypothetical protein